MLRDPERYRFASAFAEFLDRVLTGEEPAPELFPFAVRGLEVIDEAPSASLPELFRGMQLRVASLLGYAPQLDRCLRCGRECPDRPIAGAEVEAVRPWLFRSAEGGAVCPVCAEGLDASVGQPLTPRAMRRLRAMARGHAAGRPSAGPLVRDAAARVGVRRRDRPPTAWMRALDRLVEDFLRFHFESYRGLRSLQAPPGTSCAPGP